MPHGTDEAEDRHSNFYDTRVNLAPADERSVSAMPAKRLCSSDYSQKGGSRLRLGKRPFREVEHKADRKDRYSRSRGGDAASAEGRRDR